MDRAADRRLRRGFDFSNRAARIAIGKEENVNALASAGWGAKFTMREI